MVTLATWILVFDGSKNTNRDGIGIVIISPRKKKTVFSFRLDFKCSNNQVKYEAQIIGLEILAEIGVLTIHIKGDSNLVIRKHSGEFLCKSWALSLFNSIAINLLREFDDM